jgi:sodium-dependent dicarboxylate transporter 2/3/5
VLRASGLTERLASAVLSRTRSVRSLFAAATGVIVATALFVPSTSGRAALLLPVYLALAAAIDDSRIRRALALLFPTVILLSAGGSLIGAGAHLIAIEMIQRSGGSGHGYLGWLLLGMPLALLASFGAAFVILLAFLRPEERARAIALPTAATGPFPGSSVMSGRSSALSSLAGAHSRCTVSMPPW